MKPRPKICCIGEVLWDSLPSGLYLGGAPLNVCYHLNRLGIDSVIASRVGNDRLGKEALRRIKNLNIPTELIQLDEKNETGFVEVKLTMEGDPRYEILKPAAWDHIELSDPLGDEIKNCWGLVFGSLAQRHEISRKTIQELWKNDVRLIFDMNLRKPFINEEVLHLSLQKADIVKMNEEELNYLKDWYSLSGSSQNAVETLADQFNCPVICITKGAKGSMLFLNSRWYEHKGFPVKTKDVVGAGDAFLASLLYGIITKKEGKEMLACANATGAVVARKDGAMPDYSVDEVLSERG